MPLPNPTEILLKYLGIYKLTADEYADRISGEYPNNHWWNSNWFVGIFDESGHYGDGPYSDPPKRGLFKKALGELLGYQH